MRLRPKNRARWERWFAWHPVIIDNVTVWFEVIERRRYPDIFDWVYSYRTIDRDLRRRRVRSAHGPRRRKLADLWRV